MAFFVMLFFVSNSREFSGQPEKTPTFPNHSEK